MSVGHAVCAIVNQKPSPVDLDQGVARMKLVAPSRGGSSTTSPTRTSTTSSTTSSGDDEGKRTCGSDSSSGKSHRKVEQNGSQVAQKVPMARPRSSSVVGAKGLLALCVLSIPLGINMRGLDGAGKQDGFQGRLDVATSSRARCDHQCLHSGKSGRLHLVGVRNRVGIKDPILDGMLAAKASKGTAQAVRKEAYAEAQKQAQILAAQDRLQEAARELLGPKGGLPTLKKDLIKLAAFLEQPVDEKATVDQLKNVLRPLVADMFKGNPKKSTSSSSSQAVVPQVKSAPPFPQRPLPVAVQSQGLLPTMSQGPGREPYPVAMGLQSVVSTEMEEANWVTEMTEREREEAMAAGADYLYEQRLAAQYGQEAIPLPDPRRDRTGDGPISSMDLDPWTLDPERRPSTQESSLDLNPWTLDSELKAGQGQLVAQAWQKHEADRVRISKSPRQILEVMEVDYFKEMKGHLNEIFVSSVDLDSDRLRHDGIFLSEVYTNSQR